MGRGKRRRMVPGTAEPLVQSRSVSACAAAGRDAIAGG